MVVFVILHYGSIDDTIKCVGSLLSVLPVGTFQVIVVDNNSPDQSGKVLAEKYKNNSLVTIILNRENTGFSRGNNVGCRYAVENYNPDFICVLNNDTFIDDALFIQKVYTIYQHEEFDALGPKIWNVKRRYNQNPFKVLSTLEEINETLKFNKKAEKFLFSFFPISYYFFCKYFPKRDKYQADGLHGSAIIFSRQYYLKFADVFPEVTFMFGEESLLNYRKLSNNLKFVYNFDVTVFHNHSSSTKSFSNGMFGKWKFQHKLMLDSLYKLHHIFLNRLVV